MIALIACGILVFLFLDSAGNASRLEEQFNWLLAFNGVLACALLIWIVGLIIALIRQFRSRQFGAKLTARFGVIFATMAIVPGCLIYLISVQYLSRSVDSWFNVKVNSALQSGITLGRAQLDIQQQQLYLQAQAMAARLSNTNTGDLTANLIAIREAVNNNVNAEIFVLGQARVIAYANSQVSEGAPELPPRAVVDQLRLDRKYVNTEEQIDDEGQKYYIMRVIVPITRLVRMDTMPNETYWLQLTVRVSSLLSYNLNQVQSGFRDYETLAVSREGLRKLYTITLTTALLLTVFGALAVGLNIAQRLIKPLLQLARATHDVASGNFRQIDLQRSGDEVDYLTQSFNQMTVQLAEARRQRESARAALEASNLYLESVLAGLTTGVIVFDHQCRVRIINRGALDLLKLSDAALVEGKRLIEMPGLESFANQVNMAFASHAMMPNGSTYWEQQVEVNCCVTTSGDMKGTAFLLRGTILNVGHEEPDYLLVFDDVSSVIAANREVAWGEVARRLAHEIKNPLTPIKLSAERLAHKLSSKLQPADAGMLERSVDTIVRQVDALQHMVNEFRTYAREPVDAMVALNLNDLVTEVAELYGYSPEGYPANEPLARQIGLHLKADLPLIQGDANHLRQVLHNLLTNAQDALEGVVLGGTTPGIVISTSAGQYDAMGQTVKGVCLMVEDAGAGFGENMLNTAFEPYVTSKAHGTGLGLAIVRKIVQEHHAHIQIVNRPEGGARISILFTRLSPGS